MDALFTSTSASAVTGLSILLTSTAFTRLGHWVILLLMADLHPSSPRRQQYTLFAYSLPYPTDWRTWYAHTAVMSIGNTVHRRTT